ncbi:MAG: protein kinase [Blastocatellia bacterium]|nr:protein kinase [Blastocatellia bacterium]
MTPERYKEVGRLYRAAMEVAPAQRAAFLAAACGEDDALRQEIESLLGYAERPDNLLDHPALDAAARTFAKESAESLVGQRLGQYQILSLLGKGGMGEVYRARDTRLDRTVALKLLPAELAVDRDRMRRFVREAKAASALNHPHVATIYEIGEADGHRFIAMEYVEGRTLAEEIDGRPLDAPRLIEIGLQVADALEEAHGRGITHRDIKPANLMLTSRGRVKVLDFGLAKIAPPSGQDESSQTDSQTRTTPGLVLGTVAYMSPEQALGHEVDHRSDIFSLGATLYELATGQRPFRGATAGETIAHILQSEQAPLTQINAQAPAELARIVSKCLAKEPKQRYQSARELLDDLDQLKSTDLPAPRANPTEHTPQPPRLRAGKIAATSAVKGRALWLVAALSVAASAYWWTSRSQPAISGLSEIRSMTVLPPRPYQPGPRDEELEFGITLTIIARVGSLQQFIIRPDPESVVESYARPDQDALAAGREQMVDAVIDTRYQRVGNKFRFWLRLLRVADGATLWADTLDLETADPFAIEDALSTKLTDALRQTLSASEKQLLAKRDTNNPDARRLYVRGRLLAHKRQVPEIEKAIAYLERATALDQKFAMAHVTLGFAYASLNYLGHSPAKEVAPKAKAAYERALNLDNHLAEAHSFLAQYKHYYEWDFSGAEQSHRRALDLDPNSADAHHQYAHHLMHTGRAEQALAEIRKAEDLDPTDIFIARNVAQLLYFARRYDEAIVQSQYVIDLSSNSGPAFSWMIRAYEMKGDEQAAFAAYLKRAQVTGVGAEEIGEMKAAYAAGGLKGYWRRLLARQLEREKSRYVAQYAIAQLHAQLGDREQAFARLERAADDHNIYVTSLNIEPLWDGYRTDPRFVALVRRVGLPPAE